MSPSARIHHPTTVEYFFAEGCFITEWWNTPLDEAVSVARARVAPGATTRWHRLRDVTERYLILEGRGRVEVGDLPPEDCVFQPHSAIDSDGIRPLIPTAFGR